MTEVLKPENEDQLLDTVAWALSHGKPLGIQGHGSKATFGRSMAVDHVLDVSRMAGIVQYEPSELVLRAHAGTSLGDIQNVLEEKNQMMAFDPVDVGAILNQSPTTENTKGTLGGMVATGFAGPRRIRHGSVRDHVLGFRAISGRAEVFKSGGNVMKNVTGFDLSKLVTGSMGTLAVLSEVTIKVLPAPEKSRTVLIYGFTDSEAITAMAQAVNSPHEVSAAAHLPVNVAALSSVDLIANDNTSVTAIRVDGPAPSVEARCSALRALLDPFGDCEELHSMRSVNLWREVREATLLHATNPNDEIWRLSAPPAEGATITQKIIKACGGAAMYDWGGGLIWLALPQGNQECHQTVRDSLEDTGGHATLIRASAETRSKVPVFHPPSVGIAGLTLRIKNAFDPEGLLNPGRLYADM